MELEQDAKRPVQLNNQTPSLQTQFTFESPPLDSGPLEDGIMEAFQLEEEEQLQSQASPTLSSSQSSRSLDFTPTSATQRIPANIEHAVVTVKPEKTSYESTFGSDSSQRLSHVPEVTEIADDSDDDFSSHLVRVEPVPSQLERDEGDSASMKSEFTIDVTPSHPRPPKPVVSRSSKVPPSLIDVVASEVEWAKMVTMVDSRRDDFAKTVGVGVLFVDGTSNHDGPSHLHHDYNDFVEPDWKASGYALCMSSSKSLPYFIRLEDIGSTSGDACCVSLQSRWDFLFSLFEDAAICKHLFNAKDGLKPLLELRRDARPQNLQDPQIAAWLFSPELLPSFTFDLTCSHFLKDKSLPGHSASSNLARDVMLSMQLMASLKVHLESESLYDVFLDQEMPLVPILSLMELDGIRFDNEQLLSAERRLQEMLKDLEKLGARVCGFTVNLSSPKQVANVIFNKLGLRPPKNKERRIASGRSSTTAAILKAVSSQHPLPDIVLRYRHVQKFQATFVTSLNQRTRNGKLYSTWSQTSASTGRIISSKPDLQNLPRASLVLDSVCSDRIGSIALEQIAPSLSLANGAPPSISVRSAFVAAPGKLFVGADFSQLEMRLLAHVSQDTSLIDFFNQGKDIHALVASKWKGIPIEKVTDEDRTAAKRLVYGIMYGMGPVSLADHLGVGIDVAKRFLTQFLAAYPAVQQFIEKTKVLARSRGWVRTLFGRRRLLTYDPSVQRDYADLDWDEEEDDDMGAVFAEEEPASAARDAAGNQRLVDVRRPDRQAVNSVIQGTAADIVKRAMVRIDEELRRGYVADDGVHHSGVSSTYLLLQIHDELLYECPESSVPQVAQIIKRNMEHVVSFSVPLSVQVRMGRRWGEMKPMKVGATPVRAPLGFSDASYTLGTTSTDTTFGPSATHSTTEAAKTPEDERQTTQRQTDAQALLDQL